MNVILQIYLNENSVLGSNVTQIGVVTRYNGFKRV